MLYHESYNHVIIPSIMMTHLDALWALFFLILSGPVGPYYPTGFKPVSLLADPSFVRAWPGGSGNTKMGANYAPTLLVQKIAEQKFGCQQVWAGQHALIGKRVVLMGGINFVFIGSRFCGYMGKTIS